MRVHHFAAWVLGILLVAGMGSPSYGQSGRAIFDVKAVAYGAVGDGTTDDTAAIQSAINAAYASTNDDGAIVFFPIGEYRITDTLVVPENKIGVDFIGASGTYYGYGPTSGTRPPAMLKGDFIKSMPLIRFSGSGSKWADLVIVGQATSNESATPSAIFLTTEGTGSYVQQILFERVYFYAFYPTLSKAQYGGIAVQIADSDGEAMNSEFSFRHCVFNRFTTAVLVNNDQGLDYVFEQITAVLCKTVLDMSHGGNMSFNVATFSGCGGTGTDDWVFKFDSPGGPGCGVKIITCARFEAGSKQFVRVNGNQHVQFDGLSENVDNGSTTAPIKVGSGRVTFNAGRFHSLPLCQFVTPGVAGHPGTVRFRDCIVPMAAPGSTFPNAPTSGLDNPPSGLITGSGTYVFLQCTGTYNNSLGFPIANYGSADVLGYWW